VSMDHKAYQLDYERFEAELAPILARALETGAGDELRAFVEGNLSELKDPNEGEPLGPNWHELVEPPEPNRPDLELQLSGDLALTKYYDPSQDDGLSTEWADLDERLKEAGVDATRIVLGRQLQVDGRVFDPGRQGAYFQSPSDVRNALKLLDSAALDDDELVDQWRDVLHAAEKIGKGLYVTF
jgi:hypothetical protein